MTSSLGNMTSANLVLNDIAIAVGCFFVWRLENQNCHSQ